MTLHVGWEGHEKELSELVNCIIQNFIYIYFEINTNFFLTDDKQNTLRITGKYVNFRMLTFSNA